MNRVNTRIRSDVKDGDVVVRRKGWWVTMDSAYVDGDITEGSVYKVWQGGMLRDLNSAEWLEMGFGVEPVTNEARENQLRKDLEDTEKAMQEDGYEDITGPVLLGILAAIVSMLLVALIREFL